LFHLSLIPFFKVPFSLKLFELFERLCLSSFLNKIRFLFSNGSILGANSKSFTASFETIAIVLVPISKPTLSFLVVLSFLGGMPSKIN
jgi:hypothetical protein